MEPHPLPPERTSSALPPAFLSRPHGLTWKAEARWFAAEIVIIVAGVLIALAVDAWWADREARAREQLVLADLHRDFVQNQDAIARVQADLDAHLQHFLRFEQIAPETLADLPPDSVGLLYAALIDPATFDPIRGSVDALVASGDLGLIRDPALRGALTSFLGLVDDTQEERDVFMQTVLNSADRMTLHGGPWGVPGSSAVLTASDLLRLRQDAVLVGKARVVRLAGLEYAGELARVDPVIDRIVAATAPN